jgi:transformation/transcription domain-associated protein
MLETPTYLLAHSEPAKKDLFVELTLTVPVRLTNLLPHLGYLMKPLVHALNAGPDLVSQGLRTLELCIDNLTSEFLDPTMGPVFRDLMAALYSLLQPLPFNHQHSHSAVKILGKLGGRNRRFQQRPYLLDYKPMDQNIHVSLSMDNHRERLAASHWIDLAARAVPHSKPYYRTEAVAVLKSTSLLFLQSVSSASP